MKKMISELLALIILSSALAACAGGETTDKDTEVDTSAVTSAEETTGKLPLDLDAGLDYGGYVIRVLTPTAEPGDSFVADYNGDMVNDALYNRDLTVSNLLNVKIEPISYANGPSYSTLQTTVLAGDDAYDFMHLGASTYFANRPTYEKILLDLSAYENIDLSAPWWNEDAIRELSYNGKSIKYLIGDISLSSISGASVIFYNKAMFGDIYQSTEQPYDDVVNGTWTLDRFAGYCAGAYSDVDGDGEREESDIYGAMSNPWMIQSLYNGFSDTRFYSRDADGYVRLDLDAERVVKFGEKLYSLIWENQGFYYIKNDQWHTTACKLFANRGTLFATYFLSAVESADLRQMEDDYGILPFFKLDESQAEYRSDLNPSGTRWVCVPITCSDPDMVTAVIEALSYESYYSVTPEYYEVALKTKYSRDEMSGAVIDIVRDSIHTDYLIGIYRSTIGQHFANCVRDGKTDFVSSWEKQLSSYTKQMEAAYKDLDS